MNILTIILITLVLSILIILNANKPVNQEKRILKKIIANYKKAIKNAKSQKETSMLKEILIDWENKLKNLN